MSLYIGGVKTDITDKGAAPSKDAPPPSAPQDRPQEPTGGASQPTSALPPKPLPFMASGFDNTGNPYYGGGFQGWAKKWFGSVFNKDALVVQDDKLQGQYEQVRARVKDGIESKFLDWSSGVTGITGNDYKDYQAQRAIYKQSEVNKGSNAAGVEFGLSVGEISRSAGMAALGVLEGFGAIDYVKRKDIMTKQAQYELAKETDLYKSAQQAGVPEWLIGRGQTWEADWIPNGGFIEENPLFQIATASTVGVARGLGRAFQSLAILTDKDAREKAGETFSKYWSASGAAYTMVSDAAKRQKIIDRINAGDDPALVAVEEQDMWTELGGSVVNDPTTYLGMSVFAPARVKKVGDAYEAYSLTGKLMGNAEVLQGAARVFSPTSWVRIGTKESFITFAKVFETPTFGELLGVGMKAATKGKALSEVSAIDDAADEIKRIKVGLEEMKKAGNFTSEDEAFKGAKQSGFTLLDIVKKWETGLVKNVIPNTKTPFGLSSEAKRSKFYKSTHDALQYVLHFGGTEDDILARLKNIRGMFTGTDEQRAFATINSLAELNESAMSDGILQLGKFLSKFEDDSDIALLARKDKLFDRNKLVTNLVKKIDNFSKDFYPSMDEMEKAANDLAKVSDDYQKSLDDIAALEEKIAKQASFAEGAKQTSKLNSDLAKLKKLHSSKYGRMEQLAKYYDQISDMNKKVRTTLRAYENLPIFGQKAMKRYMNTIYMVIPPATAMRQFTSQLAQVWADMGVIDTVGIAFRGGLEAVSNSWTASILENNASEIKKLLGYVPEAMYRGVGATGDILQEGEKGKGMLRVTQNLDALFSSEITLRMARRELDKVLRNNKILNYENLAKTFDEKEVNLIRKLVFNHSGDVDKAMSEFQKLAQKGEIETWRFVQMPQKVASLFGDAKVYQDFLDLQQNSASKADFEKGFNALLAGIKQKVKEVAAYDPPAASNELADKFPEVRDAFLEAQEMMNDGNLSEIAMNSFNNKINAFEYFRTNSEMAAQRIRKFIDKTAAQNGVLGTPEYDSLLQNYDGATRWMHDIYGEFSKPANSIRKLWHELNDLSNAEKMGKLPKDFDVAKLSGLSRNQLENADRATFNRALQRAYFKWSDDWWSKNNVKSVDTIFASLENLAQAAGTKIDDALAGDAEIRDLISEGIKYKDKAFWYRNYERYSDDLATVAKSYGLGSEVKMEKTVLKILNDHLPETFPRFTSWKNATERIDHARLALFEWDNLRGGQVEQAVRSEGWLEQFSKALPATDVGTFRTEHMVEQKMRYLPKQVQRAMQEWAGQLLSELPKDGREYMNSELGGGYYAGSTNPKWWNSLKDNEGKVKGPFIKALEAIRDGKDDYGGSNYTTIKSMISDLLVNGSEERRVPPSLAVIDALGQNIPDKVRTQALDLFNEFSGTTFSKWEDAVAHSLPDAEKLEYLQKNADTFFDEAGNFVQKLTMDNLPPHAYARERLAQWIQIQKNPYNNKRVAIDTYGINSYAMKTFGKNVEQMNPQEVEDLILSFENHMGDKLPIKLSDSLEGSKAVILKTFENARLSYKKMQDRMFEIKTGAENYKKMKLDEVFQNVGQYKFLDELGNELPVFKREDVNKLKVANIRDAKDELVWASQNSIDNMNIESLQNKMKDMIDQWGGDVGLAVESLKDLRVNPTATPEVKLEQIMRVSEDIFGRHFTSPSDAVLMGNATVSTLETFMKKGGERAEKIKAYLADLEKEVGRMTDAELNDVLAAHSKTVGKGRKPVYITAAENIAKQRGIDVNTIAYTQQDMNKVIGEIDRITEEFLGRTVMGKQGEANLYLNRRSVIAFSSLESAEKAGHGEKYKEFFNAVTDFMNGLSDNELAAAARVAGGDDAPAIATMAKKEIARRKLSRYQEAFNTAMETMRGTPNVTNVSTATGSQQLHETMDSKKFFDDLYGWRDAVMENWGVTDTAAELSPQKMNALNEWGNVSRERMGSAKYYINRFATASRDNILLDYDKTYGDLGLAILKPYHYWQTRQYSNVLMRAVDHPSWMNGYLKYKDAMARENNDLPEWYRYNINIANLPGVHLDHPVFVNLETMVNPIYDLTGTDYNDPYKRVDWLSRSVDDLTKTGGSFTPLVQWAVALKLYGDGEQEAGQRWMGRLLGRSGVTAKALLTKAGADINLGPFVQHNEIDPFVNFMMGGLDPNERKRVGRAMWNMPGITPEQAIDAMNTQKGPIWDAAVMSATSGRANAELAGFFTGWGFKPRTQSDAQIEKVYEQIYQLRSQRDLMSPEDYRKAWDALRTTPGYEMMDALLLSGKSTPDRETAYAYNVLSRIPPGYADNALKEYGVTYQEIQNFYDSKGDFSKWKEADKMRFMGAMANLGAVFKLPDGATQQDWTKARQSNKDMRDQIEKQFGKDIWDKIDQMWDLKDSNYSAYQRFMEDHPEIEQAQVMRSEMIMSDPRLYTYYGSISTVQEYWNGQNRAFIEQKLGKEIFAKVQDYYDLKEIDPAEAKNFYKQNKLWEYFDLYEQAQRETNKKIGETLFDLPNAPEIPNRAGEPMNVSAQQTAMELYSQLTPAMLAELQNYYQGEELDDYAKLRIEKLANRYDMTSDEVLQYLAMLQ